MCGYVYKKLNKIFLKRDLENEKTEVNPTLVCIKN